MSNIEIVRRGIEAFNRRDLTAALALWSSDAEIDWSRANGPFKRRLPRPSRAGDLL